MFAVAVHPAGNLLSIRALLSDTFYDITIQNTDRLKVCL